MTDPASGAPLIRSYFDLAASPDLDAYLALFRDDARVEDDGRTHIGTDAIRAWRHEVPEVEYSITGIEDVDGGATATADVSGDFPGSPIVGFRFEFEVVEDRVQVLRITPPAG